MYIALYFLLCSASCGDFQTNLSNCSEYFLTLWLPLDQMGAQRRPKAAADEVESVQPSCFSSRYPAFPSIRSLTGWSPRKLTPEDEIVHNKSAVECHPQQKPHRQALRSALDWRHGRVVNIEEAPPYLRRDFILSGYYVGNRHTAVPVVSVLVACAAEADLVTVPPGGTHAASIYNTLFGLNNETLNAYTMLAGVVVSVACFVWAWCVAACAPR